MFRFIQTIFSKSSMILAVGLLIAGTMNSAQAAPGDLDQTFGTGGRLLTRYEINSITFKPRATPEAMIIQPDGKIIAAGHAMYSTNGVGGTYAFAVVRYQTNGSLDTGFGNGGRVLTPVGIQDGVHALALQADGKIIAAGVANVAVAGSLNFAFAIVRYNTDGTLDTSFGMGGKVVNDFTENLDEITGVAVQPDGKIVATGFVNAGYATDFALARYNSDGSFDTSFGVGGVVRTDFSGTVDGGHEMVLMPDGKIVVAGSVFDNLGAAGDFALIRYNANGTLDASFGTGGKVTTDFGASENLSDIALTSDNKLVCVGSTGQPGAWKFAVVRYNLDGTLDATFDGDGKFIYDYPNSDIDGASAVAIQQNGKIVVAGDAQAPSGSYDFTVLRLNPNGGVDTTFGNNGKTFVDFGVFRPGGGFTNDELTEVRIQADGKIVVVGDVEVVPNQVHDIGLARFLGDPVTTTRRTASDFDGDGKADISVFRPSDGGWNVLRSQAGFSATSFGLSSDKIAPADYDGDGKTDVAVYRDGSWYWLRSSDNGFRSAQLGQAGDVPLPADYDGDGKAELAVYRTGVWYMLNLTTNQTQAVQFGASADKPVPADYDGDGKTDAAVYRDGRWYLLRSSQGFTAVQFGEATDKPTVGDYDGDGKADPAIYRDGVWHMLRSQAGYASTQFGIATDVPAAADYDGDGRTDIAVFREGSWYLSQTTAGFAAVQFGIVADKPIPSAFMP